MSRESIKEDHKSLDKITEEHTPVESGAVLETKSSKSSEDHEFDDIPMKSCCRDKLKRELRARKNADKKFTDKDVEELLQKKEAELIDLYEKRLDREVYLLKDRCDYILLNEQIRASHMLREAHRERQEKVSALQTQLECKNMAALMYVLCTERRKTKLEKLRIIEAYQNYITGLENILVEAQELILHLSRGYKTAARVDYEWKEKMRNVLREFVTFINDFAGGTPDTNQYFFNIPELLKTEAPIVDNPNEDPCECVCGDGDDDENPCTCDDVKPVVGPEPEKEWWERMDDEDSRPFIMFGDMEQFKPPQRREVLRKVKAAKTAPRKWKEYAFHDMFLQSNCPHADDIKDVYPEVEPATAWECFSESNNNGGLNNRNTNISKMSFSPHARHTAISVDIRGGMGSILKIMTTANMPPAPAEHKANILGARDSIEIQSTQKLRKDSRRPTDPKVTAKVEVLDINANRRASAFAADEESSSETDNETTKVVSSSKTDDDEKQDAESMVASIVDSLQMQSHQPEPDHKIHYEKVCPMEKCKRMQVDEFMRTLPPYMRASPFMHFEQTFDEYETCTPEQLEILKTRIEEKKLLEKSRHQMHEPGLLDEWEAIPGVAVQTSDLSISLPPCSCRVPSPTPVSSTGKIYDLTELVPVKETLDKIHETCFYDSRIQFDRFKVIGEDSKDSLPKPSKDVGKSRLQEITKVLKVHPSLLDIFQANQQ